MNCGQCGTENKVGDKFCEQCGAVLGTTGEVAGGAFGATVVAAPSESCVMVRLDGTGRGPFSLGSRVIVGRLDTCDIPVDDKSVSREHARLSRLRDGYVIEDLGSTNGTLVNGRRIDEAVILRPGDVVTIGSIDFRFDLEGATGAGMAGQTNGVPAPWNNEPSISPAEVDWNSLQALPGDGNTVAVPQPTPWTEAQPNSEPADPSATVWATPTFPSTAGSDELDAPRGPDITFPPLEPFVQRPTGGPGESSAEFDHEVPPPIPKFAEAYAPVEEPCVAEVKPAPASEPEYRAPAEEMRAAVEREMVPSSANPSPGSASLPTSPDDVDPSSDMADQFSGFIRELTRQVRDSKNDQVRTQLRLDTLQAEYDSVLGRLQILQDADVARAQRLHALQDEHRSASEQLATARTAVENHEKRLSSLRSALTSTPDEALPDDQRQEVDALLESMVHSPRDIDILLQTAQHASSIVSITREARALRLVLEEIGAHLESG